MEAKTFRGAYGLVEVKDGKAVKRAVFENDLTMNREVIAYTRMGEGHKSIARLIEYTYSGNVEELTFEDAGTNLHAWMETEWFFDPVHVLLHPLLSALAFLRNQGIVHGDLHPGNVCLLCKDGELSAKLIDFGCSAVVKDKETWPCHLSTRTDPRTKLQTDQRSAPSVDMEEIELASMYTLHCHRDPLALIATAVTHEKVMPLGLTLGYPDDVFALGMCVVRILTMLVDLPWEKWHILNKLDQDRDDDKKMSALVDILRCNPAWDPQFFQDLHLRFRPVSPKPEDAKRMEASARATEIRLLGVSTLYCDFFAHLTEVYNVETSDLVRRCVHPDRNRRYPSAVSEIRKARRMTKRPCRWVPMKKPDVRVKVNKDNHIHVSLFRCWMITGIVRNGTLVWWNAAMCMMNTLKRRRHALNVAPCAIKMFISKVRQLDQDLRSLPCTSWPFAYESQKKSWLTMLRLHDLA